MAIPNIPTVDLTPFFREGYDDEKRKIVDSITKACSESGFFQIVNHGIPLDLSSRALKLAKTFFESPNEEKLKCSSSPNAPVPVGYNRKPNPTYEFNEFLIMLPPGSGLNIFPTDPPKFREVMEELFSQFLKIGIVVESILSECLGLPPNVLKEFNNDRSWDFLIALFYLPAREKEKIGAVSHKDLSFFTIVLQDEVEGLEVQKDGEWISIEPQQGALVVNIGDALQVLSNDKFRSPSHRVMRPNGKTRNSFAFFYNVSGDKWVEPLPQLTKKIAEQPKYRPFLYKEYLQKRKENKSKHISRIEDEITISNYAISEEGC